MEELSRLLDYKLVGLLIVQTCDFVVVEMSPGCG